MWVIYVLFINCILRLTSGGIVVPPIEGELDWWQNAVIYEIFPQSFKDTNGDGIGDLNGDYVILKYHGKYIFTCSYHYKCIGFFYLLQV